MKEKYQNYLNYDHNLDSITLIGMLSLIIVISGNFGFIYEYIFYYFNSGCKEFYWRGGNFLPWINIYATGSIIIYFFTYHKRKHPLKVFIRSIFISGILEYISGLGMYLITGTRCWDYNQEILNFGNISGFICLRSITFFGLSALFLIYIILPIIIHIIHNIPKKTFLTISFFLLSIVLIDEFYNLIFARLLHLPRASSIYKKIGFKYVKFK